MNEIQEALEKNNTTAGKLSAVLGVCDKQQAEIERLKEENNKLKKTAQDAGGDMS